MTKAPIPLVTKEELDALRAQGKTREQIAEKFGVTVSRVKRWILTLGVSRRQVKEVEKPKDPFIDAAVDMGTLLPVGGKPAYTPKIDDGITLMDRCKVILGQRMGEDHRGYLLDSRPVSTQQIINAARDAKQAQATRDWIAQNYPQNSKRPKRK